MQGIENIRWRINQAELRDGRQVQGFVQISCHRIKDLISGDVLVIATEEEVFEIVLEWIAQNQDEKEQHFAEFD